LSLAVIYTIDWTPATRVKGVLMLVGLAYFAGISLYFLKKDMLDRVKRAFDPAWHEFQPPGANYKVRMPGKPARADNTRPPGLPDDYYHARHHSLPGVIDYWVATGPAGPGDNAWFKNVEIGLRSDNNVPLEGEPESISYAAGSPGRQWVLTP